MRKLVALLFAVALTCSLGFAQAPANKDADKAPATKDAVDKDAKSTDNPPKDSKADTKAGNKPSKKAGNSKKDCAAPCKPPSPK
jgi:hypothetical protein